LFDRVDLDNSGIINRAELTKALADGTLRTTSSLFDRVDLDNSGIINRAELNKALADGILRAKTPVANL